MSWAHSFPHRAHIKEKVMKIIVFCFPKNLLNNILRCRCVYFEKKYRLRHLFIGSKYENHEKLLRLFPWILNKKLWKILNKDLFKELDRAKAIELAIKKAKKGDLVLILGKGHEKTILRADGPHDFEDIKVVRKILKNIYL